jgi:hypothetical protein
MKRRPAFKHGGYSATAILPGENRAEFEKLQQDLIAEFSPNGVLEHDLVARIALLVWRKKNLATYRIAEVARQPFVSHERRQEAVVKVRPQEELDAADCAEMIRKDEHDARKRLGDIYELVAIGELATVSYLLRELELVERLDEMIDRCIKRLLHVRGVKSFMNSSSSAPPQRLSAPTKAA